MPQAHNSNGKRADTISGEPALHSCEGRGIKRVGLGCRKSGGSTSRPDPRTDSHNQGDTMSRRPSAAWRSLCALLTLTCFAFAARSQTLPTAQQVASNITVGWNLGNTLEAQCGETAWGNPVVTQSFINSLKAAGFNSIRI